MDNWIKTEDELAEIIAADRLKPILVRYRANPGTNAHDGRLKAPAQGVRHLIEVLEATDHYIRDLSYQ